MVTRSARPPSEYAWHCLTSGLADLDHRARRAEFGSMALFAGVYLSIAAAVSIGLLSTSGALVAMGFAAVIPASIWVTALGLKS